MRNLLLPTVTPHSKPPARFGVGCQATLKALQQRVNVRRECSRVEFHQQARIPVRRTARPVGRVQLKETEGDLATPECEPSVPETRLNE